MPLVVDEVVSEIEPRREDGRERRDEPDPRGSAQRLDPAAIRQAEAWIARRAARLLAW
ncbi:hypothetical protein [Sorangium sp. So ce513]|uniref:hypothetical protein n=1 Tax=Sorangium sp. So ce513 TaxID=3133315 RepID=UPI003F608F30